MDLVLRRNRVDRLDALQGLKSNFRFEFRIMLASFRGHLRDRISGLDLTIRPVQFPGTTSLAKGANINARGADGVTPVIWALLNHSKKGFEFLLQQGANPNLQIANGRSNLVVKMGFGGDSAVSLAARQADPWYLTTVIKYKGNVNLINPLQGYTPIFSSIQARQFQQTEILIAAGADLNFQDSNGNTPMMYAAMAARYDLVSKMLAAGADPKVENYARQTIVDYIKRSAGKLNQELEIYRQRVIEALRGKGIFLYGSADGKMPEPFK